MKVAGTLPSDKLELKGEGTVELANETDTNNGYNLVNAVKAKASNIKLNTNAKLDNEEKLEVKASDNVKID